jgi:hypothetical protein
VRLDVQLALQAARAEDLDLLARVDEARLQQGVRVDLRPVLEAAQLRKVDDRVDLLEWVLETGQLGDALRKRHLAALETEAEAFAARVLSFLAAT